MQPIDPSQVRTYPLARRRNLVQLADLIALDGMPSSFDGPELGEIAERIIFWDNHHCCEAME